MLLAEIISSIFLFADNSSLFELFFFSIKAGCVDWLSIRFVTIFPCSVAFISPSKLTLFCSRVSLLNTFSALLPSPSFSTFYYLHPELEFGCGLSMKFFSRKDDPELFPGFKLSASRPSSTELLF